MHPWARSTLPLACAPTGAKAIKNQISPAHDKASRATCCQCQGDSVDMPIACPTFDTCSHSCCWDCGDYTPESWDCGCHRFETDPMSTPCPNQYQRQRDGFLSERHHANQRPSSGNPGHVGSRHGRHPRASWPLPGVPESDHSSTAPIEAKSNQSAGCRDLSPKGSTDSQATCRI